MCMRNKVYLYNFPKLNIDKSLHKYYEIYEMELPVEHFAIYSANEILIFDNGLKSKSDYGFHKSIIYLSQIELGDHDYNLLSLLDTYVRRKRSVNPKQFEIIEGSIVRNKIDPRVGPGVVEEIDLDDEMVKVNFPQAESLYETSLITCLKSNLRVVTHIEEVKYNERKKTI
jgi:hypothetical protein